MSKFYVSAGLKIRDEFDVQEVVQALLEMVKPTLVEPGCEFFKVFQNNEDERLLTLWECWDSEGDLQAHFEEPHTLAYLAKGYTEITYVEKLAYCEA